MLQKIEESKYGFIDKNARWTFSIVVFFMMHASCASADDYAKGSTYDDVRASSMARELIAYVERYWDIAVTEKPDKVAESIVDDPSGDGRKIAFYNTKFKSFQAGFFRYKNGTPMPFELSTTSASFKLPCGLKVGQSKTKVRPPLVEPTSVQPGNWVYATGGEENGEVTFTFKREKLSRVAWKYDSH